MAQPTRLRLDFPRETGLILRFTGSLGTPSRQSRGIDPPVAIRRGEEAQLKREHEYGSPEDNFTRIAALWTAYCGWNFDAHDVAAMMALLKIARIGSGVYHADNYIDLAGYAACAGEIAAKEGESCTPSAE